jgi:hypothetical protein
MQSLAPPQHPSLHVFVHANQCIFTSPNTDQPPYDLPAQEGDDRVHRSLDTQKLHWYKAAHPYLAFTPKEIKWEGPLFGRLAISPDTVSIKQCGNGWALDRDLACEWASLEEGLFAVCHGLLSRMLVKLDFEYYPLPRTFGYGRAHKSERIARRQTVHSRDAFLPLIALCSYAIAQNSDSVEIRMSHPNWIKFLVDERKIHPDWVELLRISVMNDFSVQRAGTVFDPQRPEVWAYEVPHMIKANVPVWVFWGTRLIHPKDMQSYRYLPTPEQVEQRRAALAKRSRPQSPSHEISTQNDIPQPPPLPKNSRQRPGETWQQYFKRQEETNVARRAKESSEERARREQREDVAKKHQPPGRKGATVFHWAGVPEYPRFRVREQISRQFVEDMWDDYSDNQRRFDGFSNEWDICTEFSPDDISDSLAYEIAYGGGTTTRLEDALPRDMATDLGHEHYRRDLENIYKTMSKTMNDDFADQILQQDDFHDILPRWYGLCLDSSKLYEHITEKQWNVAHMILGQPNPIIDKHWMRPVAALVKFFVPRYEGPDSPPERDLDSPSLIQRNIVSSDLFVRYSCACENPGYLLQPKISDRNHPQWTLMVEDPAAILYCLRSLRGHSSAQIALHLASRGIPFYTLQRRIAKPVGFVQLSERLEVGLGWRNLGYEVDAFEYAIYEAKRSAFLRREPQARAALLAGGLVWRLAVESLGKDLSTAILSGPSVASHTYGFKHCSFRWCNETDDILRQDELDLICGVYKVYTGTSYVLISIRLLISLVDRGDQTSDKSWWPKHQQWQNSGMDWGYWTPTCERWFTKRLAEIKSGKAGLKSAKEWHSGPLKSQKHTPKLVSANKQNAKVFLRHIISQ